MTIDEFLEAEEEPGYRYELARGVIEVTQVPNDPHGQVVSNLYRMAFRYDEAHPGQILRVGGGNEFQLVLPGMNSGRNPDFSIVFKGSAEDFRGRRMPALVAEVVSKDSVDRDYRAKRDEYLTFGIPEYWIIDLLLRKMTVLVRHGDTFVERPCSADQPIPSHLLRGLMATPDDLWIDLHEYQSEETTDV
jgi:Uma2 family endonuclease